MIAADPVGAGAWPEGAAAVKRLYASATDTEPAGFALYVKLAASSADGANWYWYERAVNGNVVEGIGKGTCVGCHVYAGSDAVHTPSPGSRDFVYTPVAP